MTWSRWEMTESAGIAEVPAERWRREHEALGHCPAQPCMTHGVRYYSGREPGPWEWETREEYDRRMAARFLGDIASAYGVPA